MGRHLDIDDPGFDYYREERGNHFRVKLVAGIALAAMATPWFFPETFATVAGPLARGIRPASEVYYRNCAEARAANAAPIFRIEAGYRSELDADGDGIACESKPGRSR